MDIHNKHLCILNAYMYKFVFIYSLYYIIWIVMQMFYLEISNFFRYILHVCYYLRVKAIRSADLLFYYW